METRRKFSCLLLLVFAWLLCGNAIGQEDIDFNRISVDQGLSQNTIFAILQDHKGFMWFGTHDGLNKFDGYNFTVFKNRTKDSTSISDNIVMAICQSKKTNAIWLGTNDGGLSRFDYETEIFTSYKNTEKGTPPLFASKAITNIVEDEAGLLWFSYKTGTICCFDPKTEQVKNYALNPQNHDESGFGDLFVYSDSRNFLWVCTKKGLYKFDKELERFEIYQNNKNNPHSIPSNLLNAIYEDSNYVFWVSSEEGLIKFAPDRNEFSLFQHNEKDPFSISDNHVYIAIRDNNNRLWVGTRNGLNSFTDSTNRFWAYKNEPANPTSLSSNNVSKLYIDQAGVLWVGTFEHGLNFFDTHRKAFTHYQYDSKHPDGLPAKTVRAIYEDAFGILWIGCVNGGLTKLDRKQQKAEHFDLKINNSFDFGTTTVTSICDDAQGNLWIGTWEHGIIKATFKGRGTNRVFDHFKTYTHQKDDAYSLSNSSVQFIFLDSDKRLWIGTAEGLDMYDRTQDRFKHFTYDRSNRNSLSDLSLQNAMVEVANQTFWVGTWNGLNKIILSPTFDADFEKAGSNINSLAKFEHFFHEPNNTNSLSDNRVISACMNTDGSLWVGTFGGGLNKMVFQKDGTITFSHFDEQSGLTNNVVYCVFSDESGNIWCSSNNGISEIKSGNKGIVHYKEKDGLQGKEFFWGAGWKSRSGELFFGGSNGFNAFFPLQIQENKYKVPVVFTNLRVFNKIIQPDGKILHKTISEAEKIHLNWSDKVISIEFSALHFSLSENIKYQYMLVGFDKKWISTNFKNRMITYTNLEPGHYTFKVKATNCDGIWNDDHASLSIIIKPPFWKTWAFQIAAILFIIGVGPVVFLVRLRNIQQQNRKLETLVKERTVQIENQKDEIAGQNKELIAQNVNKIKLISILSHDLRSPIATVINMLEMILTYWDSFNDTEKIKYIDSLQKDVETTLKLVDDTLDFVRINQNKLEPHPSKKSLVITLGSAIDAYTEQAKAKNIDLLFNCDFEEEFETDHEMLQHIVMNFVSNAIKFTPNSKIVELKVVSQEDQIEICVFDQGIGIPEDKLKHLFEGNEGFNRTGTDGEKTHGIGLQLVKQYADLIKAKIVVESKVDHGSQFCLVLPKF